MIDPSLAISSQGALLFHLKQGFWLYGWPLLIGFLTIVGYQAMGRIVMLGSAKWPTVFALGSAVSMVSLFGWVTMVRSMGMIPFYGCGVGLASAIMSRVYAVTLPRHPRLKIPTVRVVWRGDAAGIVQLQQALRARTMETGVEVGRARV
ncbi:MAG TPA: hypothetical protein VGJ09_13400 [Bryobacteraceae bacterium]|jgi:hypothetical protein